MAPFDGTGSRPRPSRQAQALPPWYRSIHEHVGDPQELHAEARGLGLLVADGILNDGTGEALLRLALRIFKTDPMSGAAIRAAWSYHQSRDDRRREWDRCEDGVVRAVVPLLERRRPAAEILAAAREQRGLLSEDQARQLAEAEVAVWLRAHRHG